jgi:Ca2+-transporting ATPase
MSILKSDVDRWRETNFHLIPGRLRIGVPGLLNNQDFANGIAHHIVKFTGVKVCYANPISGQVLINYDPNRTDLKQLLSWIFRLEDGSWEVDRFPAPGRTNNNFSQEQQEQCLLATGEGKATPWHLLNNSDVLALLGSSPKTGLSHRDARERLVTFGHNVLKGGEKNTLWQVALSSLDGLMIKLLLISGGVSLLVGEKTDAAVIVAIVLVQAAVETAQNYRAEKSLDNLKEFTSPVATVLRGGEMRKISCRELVPGDILYLDAGDIVPADAVIVEAISLTTNEACLTGESIPVVKDSQHKSDPRIPIADQSNMLFSGTNIIGGRATAVVVTTGMQTELGRIARLLGDVREEQTNLQKQLDFLGHYRCIN